MINQQDASTRPGEMSRVDAKRIAHEMEQARAVRTGGRISDYHDARLTKVFEWLMGIAAVIIIGLLGWVGSGMVDLKVKTAELSVSVMLMQPMQAQMITLSDDVSDVKRDIAGVKKQVEDIQERQRQAIDR